ncbi:MAG: class I SAM-dependent methyltransferase [Deltaproteobacteria bacterium]|nr:MAG: class I SAM-dependent methyltransferase [Deltaproteobacteria bacterium]
MDNRSYYDDFAAWYERERGRGYHQMLDDLEIELVERYGRGKRVLEVGCGTGLLLARAAQFADTAVGVDLSAGMLARARDRGLRVAQGSATELPYPDASFDVVYSVKVLAHVEAIREALAEMARVTAPGGVILAEFYNPLSLRGLVKKIKPASRVSETTTDEAVYTRYDTPAAIRRLLPDGVTWETTRGVRIVTPVAAVHKIPLVGRAVRAAEQRLADVPGVRAFGGFLIAVLRRQG